MDEREPGIAADRSGLMRRTPPGARLCFMINLINGIRRPITAVTSLFDRSFDPARARQLPIRNEASESNVRGLEAVGSLRS